MSVVIQARYTCDRCKQVSIQQKDYKPGGWIELVSHWIDRMGNGPNLPLSYRKGMLCADCRDSFDEWWKDA